MVGLKQHFLTILKLYLYYTKSINSCFEQLGKVITFSFTAFYLIRNKLKNNFHKFVRSYNHNKQIEKTIATQII